MRHKIPDSSKCYFRRELNHAAKEIFIYRRDGTLLVEPPDQQIDNLNKFAFVPGVITALSQLKRAGFILVLVYNQDGLGTPSFLATQFKGPQEWMLAILRSEGIEFEAIRICPHFANEKCACRKPQVGLLLDYLRSQQIDRDNSYVIGDRATDLELANNMGIKGLQLGSNATPTWSQIVVAILLKPRCALIERETKETKSTVNVNLDNNQILETILTLAFLITCL